MFEDRNEKARAKQRSAEDWCSSPEVRALLAGIAERHGLSPTDADDVLQETLIALLRAGPDVHVCRIWILKVAARKAIDMVRSSTAMGNREDCYARSRALAGETPELRYLLRVRAGQLPSRLRLVYELRYVQGLTEREAAAELDIGRSSVRRLDQQLRSAIARNSPPGPASARRPLP